MSTLPPRCRQSERGNGPRRELAQVGGRRDGAVDAGKAGSGDEAKERADKADQHLELVWSLPHTNLV